MKNLSKSLKLSAFFLSVIIILLSNLLIWYGSKSFLIDEIKIDLNNQVNLARKIINLNSFVENDYNSLKNFSNEIKNLTGLRTTLISKTGTVLADSEIDIQELGSVENHFGRPEVQEAFSSGSGFAIRRSSTINKDLMYYCENLYSDKRVVGFIRFALFSTNFDKRMGNVTNLLIFSDIIFLIIIISFFYFFNKKLRLQFTGFHEELERIRDIKTFTDLSPQKYGEFDSISVLINSIGSQLQNNIKLLSDKSSELFGIFNSLEVAVAAFNNSGKILYFNTAFTDAMLNSPSAETGEYFYNYITFPPLINNIHEYLKNKSAIKKRTKYYNDTYIEYQITPLKINSSEDIGFLITITDVTDMQKTEIMRQDFVANVSHEFKTPLTSIRGYAETLLNIKTKTAEIQDKFLNKITKHTYLLESIVNNLLQLSRIEKNENINLAKINPVPIVREIADDFQIQCSVKNIIFESVIDKPDGDVFINANVNLIQLLVSNLLTNALQYSREHGHIWLRLHVSGNTLTLEIEDTGIGIPAKEIQRIFERFYRVEEARNIYPEGTGLGLSIVKNIVELLKAEVEIESHVNKGTIFRIKIGIC